MLLRNYCVFLLVVSISTINCKELPTYLQDLKCKVDKDFTKCFLENANKAIPFVARGDPEYDIPKLDPFEIPFLQLINTASLKLNITDVKVFGLEKSKIVAVKAKPGKGSIYFEQTMKNENLTVVGNYVINGKLLVMEISGNGPFSILLKDGVLKVSANADIIKKDDGEQYYRPKDVKMDYLFGKVVFHFSNLFQGDKVLESTVNNFLNENWDLILLDFGPGISDLISSIVLQIFVGMTENVPLSKIYLY